MIDPRYYKLYTSWYGENSNVGKLMYEVQQHGFEAEGMGTMISEKAANMLTRSSDDNYPILGKTQQRRI